MKNVPVIEVRIDGDSLSHEEIGILEQKVPFPGGHVYEVIVRGTNRSRDFSSLPLGQNPAPDAKQSHDVFWHLTSLFQRFCERHNESRYFLNSVTNISVGDDEVAIRGVCSPVIKEKTAS